VTCGAGSAASLGVMSSNEKAGPASSVALDIAHAAINPHTGVFRCMA
jgi:hypothetical protein